MAGCSCATRSASASGSDLRWERLEDEAFYWGGRKGHNTQGGVSYL